MNPMTLIDGYKLDHRRQYPPGTERVYSNFTPRGSRVEGQTEVVFLGLQYALQKYLIDEMVSFFFTSEDYVAERYAKRVNAYLGPNAVGTDHIRALHRLGYIPLEFRAIPEGTAVPLRVPMFTVENTHPDFAWVTNYFETLLSCELWMPCTSATTALRMRRLLERYATRTGAPTEFVPWQGHDFSFRGMPGVEAAVLSGMGHLLYFTGTDTIPAIDAIEEYYGVPDNYCIAGSVAATEHSVMCAGGRTNEYATYKRLLDLYPSGIVSIVSDTWDLWEVLTDILPSLKEQIMARDGKLVIRPDSGNPVQILCGDHDAPDGSPARRGVVRCLWDLFGGTENAQGFKMLDAHIGCIYGDSISYERAEAILEGLARNGFASSNVVFGMGSYTYQYVTRDTYNFAMKATWAQIGGHGVDLFKKPVTDDGMKASAMGRLAVLPSPAGDLVLVNQATDVEQSRSALRPVWRDGEWIVRESFDVIRARALR
jgi:nicotinamide phosphoribosyltransferase